MARIRRRPLLNGRVSRRLQRRDRVVMVVAGAFALVVALAFTLDQAHVIRQAADGAVAVRAQLIEGQTSAYARTVEALGGSVQRSMAIDLPQDDLRHLRDHPEYGVYALSGFSVDGGQTMREGTLTGMGTVAGLDGPTRREIVAVLALDGQIAGHLSRGADAVWIYYTSARKFMYLAPKVPVSDFQASADQYDNAFWTEAVPAANPGHKTVVTKLYEDGAGQGLMITISHPVMLGQEFLGVTSADIGIARLRSMLTVGTAAGVSELVGADGDLVARRGDLHPGQTVAPAIRALGPGTHRIGLSWFTVRPLLGGQLTLVHELGVVDTAEQAFAETSGVWALMLLVLVMAYLMLRLRGVLGELTTVTRTDPLTKVLNRRGFLDDVHAVSRAASRQDSPQSLALIDLDRFKEVNDTLGHAEGDQVLADVAALLAANIRTGDLVCRWGGEEFAVLLPHADVEGAQVLVERLLELVSASVRRSDGAPITFSAGIVNAPPDVDIDRVLAAADQLLYEAKLAGRNCVRSEQRAFATVP